MISNSWLMRKFISLFELLVQIKSTAVLFFGTNSILLVSSAGSLVSLK